MSSASLRFDAFLSYNSQDRSAVEEIARRLRAECLTPYLEVDELAPGREFQPGLAEALRDSKVCVMFLGPSGLGPWQREELQVAIDRRVRDPEFHVIPVLLPGAERPRRGDVAHLEFLINASWVEFLGTLDDSKQFGRLLWGITGKKPAAEVEPLFHRVCPYRGLEAFGPEDARYLFGRENLTGWLVSALRREVKAAQGVRFLGVLGPSGSGKSSVVLAGLVPRLMAGAIEGSERWPVVIVRPGGNPLERLTEKVVPRMREVRPDATLSEMGEQEDLLNRLRAKTEDAAGALNRYVGLKFSNEADDRRFVIVVDQFEEVFTYRPQGGLARERFERDRDQFFANLLNVVATPGGRAAVVLAMRSDFLSACAMFPQLSAVLSAHQELVGPMTADELRAAIEQPAFLVGCEVEPALTERLLGNVKGQSGALPLMQFALTEVWKKRDVRRLTLSAYEDLGKDDQGKRRGIEGVLDHRANEIYNKLSPEDQNLCRRLFLRLVQPGEGTEDTKRRVPYSELLPADPVRAAAAKTLIQTLASQDIRLITTEGTVATDGAVEVAHEALIRGWKQLRQWVNDERAGLRTQRRLSEDAKEWAAAKPDTQEGHLYSRARLAVAREWVEAHRGELNTTEVEFVAASDEAERLRKQDALENERRLRQAAEAAQEAERKRAEGAEAATRRQEELSERLLAAANAATEARLHAECQARLAESRRLAALSEMERGKNPDRALILAVEALGGEETTEARDSLFRALHASPRINAFLQAEEGGIRSVAFSPDGRTLATSYADKSGGGVVLWDAQKRKRRQAEPLLVAEGYVTSVAFSPDGRTLATSYAHKSGGGVVLWDMPQGIRRQGEPLVVDGNDVSSVAFSPDGQTLAACCNGSSRRDGGRVILSDAQSRTWRQVETLSVAEGSITSVAFSPDGLSLATAYGQGPGGYKGVVLWDVRRRTRLLAEPLTAPEDGDVASVAFSPDGQILAAGYDGGGVVLWDIQRRARLQTEPLRVADGGVWSVAFSPDGRALATGYTGNFARGGGGVVLWDRDRLARLEAESLTLAEMGIRSVTFSPDGQSLAAVYELSSGEGGVVLWSSQRRPRLAAEPLSVAEGGVKSLAFSPDGQTLATAYNGFSVGGGPGGVVLWDAPMRTRLQAEPLPGDTESVSSVAFSPDGRTLAAEFFFHVVFWEASRRTRLPADALTKVEGRVRSVAFSPDGQSLAVGYTASGDGVAAKVVLWNAQERTRRRTEALSIPEGDVESVAFSPDGRTLAVGYAVQFGRSGGVVLWDAQRRTRIQAEPLSVAEGDVTSIVFSPDGRTLACGYTYLDCVGGVVLWDVQRRGRLRTEPLEVADGGVTSVAFSPDGRTLASGYYTFDRVGGVVLWDVQRCARLQTEPLRVADGGVTSVAFSPDGRTLASGYEAASESGIVAFEGGVLLWNVDIESWKQRAAQVVNRNLSLKEWRRIFPEMTYRPTFPSFPSPQYDEHYQEIARNLSRADWQRYFPGVPYRRTFDNLPIPADAGPGTAHTSAVGAGDVPKKNPA